MAEMENRGQRRRMRGAERYEQLLDIATRLFAEQGFSKVGTWDIARRAAIAEPTIYRHFESKRQLFLTTVARAGSQLLEGWRQAAAAAPSASMALKAVAEAFLRDLRERPHVLAMHLRAVQEADDPEVRALARAHLLEVEALLAELWERARAEGLGAEGSDPRALAWAVIGLGQLALVARALGMEDVLTSERLATIWRMLAR